MSRRKKSTRQQREQMLQYCGEIHPEDGIDPREWHKTSRSSHKQNRKDFQLCGQIARVLSFVLADCDDPIIHNMDIVSVMPNPDATCVRVQVICHERTSLARAQQALQNQIPRLQFEIAKSINRKRVPNLVFNASFADAELNEGGLIDE